MVALAVAGIIVALIILDISISRIAVLLKHRGRHGGAGAGRIALNGSLAARVAPGVFHHRGHTWAHWRPGGEAVAGADDLLHRVIGRIDEVRPPAPGESLAQGGKAVMLRQGDRVMYLTSPVTGTVTEVNAELAKNPSLLKESPYEKGWMFIIRPSNPEEDIENMMLGERAEGWMAREARRMRFFIINRLKTEELEKLGASAVEINGVFERLGDESWVLFKDQFVYQQEWRS